MTCCSRFITAICHPELPRVQFLTEKSMKNHKLDKQLKLKLDELQRILKEYKKVAVAYSGGVDSSFLAFFANKVLGNENVLLLMANNAMVPQSEIRRARKNAKTMGWHIRVFKVNLFRTSFVKNTPDRCYQCKFHSFTELQYITRRDGYKILLDGSNADDATEYRPGFKALAELGIPSPLMDVGLTKTEIRTLSRHFDLPAADKESSTCLATRIPYYTQIEKAKLMAIEKSEVVLRKLGFKNVRVRHHGDVARIEVHPKQVNELMECRKTIVEKLRKIGFIYITVDLTGYRSGAMDESLKENRDENRTTTD